MEQIGYLEDQSRFQRSISMDEVSHIKPSFIKPLTNLGEVLEGKYAHFEAQVQPLSDPFMRIEWYKDGKSITASECCAALSVTVTVSNTYDNLRLIMFPKKFRMEKNVFVPH